MTNEQPHALLLYPRPGKLAVKEVSALIEPLSRIGFISEVLAGDQQADYLAGDRFTDLVTFLGCSPDICLSPEEGANYCFIRLHPATTDYRLYSGRNTKEPHCKQCRQPQPDWRRVCDGDYCDQCGLTERIESFVWKKSAALARTAIEVMNVYPHEAVPSQYLLDSLSEVSRVEWVYAYV